MTMPHRPADPEPSAPAAAAEPALSRVNAHAAPPSGTDVRHTEFRGPLFASWGERMRVDALLRALGSQSPERLRDRVGIPTASNRGAWSGFDAVTIEGITNAAVAERGEAWAEAKASDFARFVRDGDRITYETALEARQQRLTRAVVTAAVTDDPAWADEAADGVVLLCEQSTWSLPAHDDAHSRRGFVISDAASPYLDLIAGEIVAQLAVADRVLGERWDADWPGLRERLRHEAETRVFAPFETRDDFWWLGYWRDVNNWNPWILGNVLLAAVLLIDDAERVARIAARALDSLDRYVATLPEDGAIDEGVAYWWNGAVRMLECLDLVARATDGELDAAAIPVVAEVLRFPMRMQLGDDWYVNVADGWARSSGTEPWQVPFRWGSLLGDHQVVAWASGGRRPGRPVADVRSGLPRLLRALSDSAWRDVGPAPAPLPSAVWLPSVQVLVARATAGDPAGLALAAKGGTNDENHNHKDLGSFIVACDGRPLLVDVGKPTYTAQTFSEHRYEIRAMQSGWHNAPAPLGLEQGAGPDFHANVVRAPNDERPVTLELDLSDAYPLSHGDRWSRTFRPVSAARAEIIDTWSLAMGSPTGTSVHLVAAGSVRIDGAEAVVRDGAAGIRITTSHGIVPTSEVWELDDPELTRVWGDRLTRLTYDLPSEGTLTTIVEALGDDERNDA
ncbi:heparinase II/III family protein [Humibacter ginsenosidimutans]|uniref:Heparinase n=1 Tax=Humibacter ginsenosidimutans TaxID=2599293 RepID=A0A5B8M761_9MICO|nr:heparinase II/III family protein [Humibacter ginsenosidimutans]QDZ16226.1 hypothetical protein FPZ11_16980 [Humibacter ginsenosidimutans]